jgi:hypothetical protein
MDLACYRQVSSHPTAVISALIVVMELQSSSSSTAQAMRRISWSPDDEVPQELNMLFKVDRSILRLTYWKFLNDPGRCGFLYNERAKCYTRIINFWLLFLAGPPDPEGPDSHEKCRKLVLANWSRILSKCVPGDKDLICRLRHFTLDQACKEDVERVIAWLEVSLPGYRSLCHWLALSARVVDGLKYTERCPRSLEDLRL